MIPTMSISDTSEEFSVGATLLRLETKFDAHVAQYSVDRLAATAELHKRPTRGEIIAWLGGAGAVSGIFFGVVGVISGLL